MIFMLTFVLYNVFIMFLVAAALVRKTTTTPNKTLFHSSVNELINPKKEYKQNDLFIVVFFLDIPSTRNSITIMCNIHDSEMNVTNELP